MKNIILFYLVIKKGLNKCVMCYNNVLEEIRL